MGAFIGRNIDVLFGGGLTVVVDHD